MPTKIPTYPREFCPWTLLQPHSYVLSLFLCKSLVDTISADQCQPRCCWSPKQKPFPEGRVASGSPLSSEVRRCSQCQHLALHRKGCTDSIGLLSYSVHCSQPFCVRNNQLIPVSLGEKKKSLNRVFMRRLSKLSAFTFTLNLHMHFKSPTLERSE